MGVGDRVRGREGRAAESPCHNDQRPTRVQLVNWVSASWPSSRKPASSFVVVPCSLTRKLNF